MSTFKKVITKCMIVLMLFNTLSFPAFAEETNITTEVVETEYTPTEQEVYASIIAMKNQYPEGMKFDDSVSYTYTHRPNVIDNSSGCAAFAYILSDTAFGELPSRQIENFSYNDLMIGDILRSSTHSVIILEVHSDYVIVAEANYNGTVHWGRRISRTVVENNAVYVETRYPEGTVAPNRTTTVENVFSDIGVSVWFHNSVQYVYDKELMVGVSKTSFAPQDTMTRAMAAEVFYNLIHPTSAQIYQKQQFADVTSDKWYYTAVQVAYQWGITSGVGDNKYDPNGVVTREMFAKFLYNYAVRYNEDIVGNVSGNLSQFLDGDSASSWATEALVWATQNGIVMGRVQDSETLLCPTDPITRAEAATMLQRYLSLET